LFYTNSKTIIYQLFTNILIILHNRNMAWWRQKYFEWHGHNIISDNSPCKHPSSSNNTPIPACWENLVFQALSPPTREIYRYIIGSWFLYFARIAQNKFASDIYDWSMAVTWSKVAKPRMLHLTSESFIKGVVFKLLAPNYLLKCSLAFSLWKHSNWRILPKFFLNLPLNDIKCNIKHYLHLMLLQWTGKGETSVIFGKTKLKIVLRRE